jgi:hypothetical protein
MNFSYVWKNVPVSSPTLPSNKWQIHSFISIGHQWTLKLASGTTGPTASSRCARLLAVDPDAKPRHVDRAGKLLSPNVYFQIENENEHNLTEKATNASQTINIRK